MKRAKDAFSSSMSHALGTCDGHFLVKGSPLAGHYLSAFSGQASLFLSTTHSDPTMPIVKARACTILGEFEQAQTELIGRAVILTDGKAGTVESVSLDEMHGLRIAISGTLASKMDAPNKSPANRRG